MDFGLSSSPATSAEAANETMDVVTEAAIKSLTSNVKDLLPDLTDFFVRACLKHYDYNAESVINAILENNLAPHLVELQFLPELKQVAEVLPQPDPVVSKVDDISKKTRTKYIPIKDTIG